MPQFRKRVIATGMHVTPDGAAPVDSARLRHWHDSIQQLLAAGIKPPVSWGHCAGATPHTDDDAAYWAARFNAGKVVGSVLDEKSGTLDILGDAPGVEMTTDGALESIATTPDGRVVRTRIEEVSIGVRDWTDGTGREWKDVPIHLALTPLPVWVPEGGQPPFEPVADKTQQRFGMGSLLYRFGDAPMAEDSDKDKGKGDKGAEAPAESGGPSIKKVIEMLGKAGVNLPPDTTPENLLERLYTACTAISESSAADTSSASQTSEGTTEAAGTFMSTVRANPVSAALLARLESEDRARRLARIKGVERRGCPAHRCKVLREEATQLRFSINPDGSDVRQAIDRELDALEAALPPEGYGLTRQTVPDGVAEHAPPEGDGGGKRHRELADQLARRAGLPGRTERK